MLPWLAAALTAGGALGNVIDRIQGGSVVDMLHTGWWPTFNLADVFICIGVAVLALSAVRNKNEDDLPAGLPRHVPGRS